MKRVYIAGPISTPHPSHMMDNLRRGLKLTASLMFDEKPGVRKL